MKTLSLIFLSLVFYCSSLVAATPKDSLSREQIVRRAVTRILEVDRRNKLNEVAGRSSDNIYLIDIDTTNWIAEKGESSKILNDGDFERISRELRMFNARPDKLRFYVIVINDYVVKFKSRVDPILLSGTFKWNDLANYPEERQAVTALWSKTSKLVFDIGEELKARGFEDRIVYFYSKLEVQDYDDNAHFYKYDRLNFFGDRMEKLGVQIRSNVKVAANAAVTNIEQAVTSIINHTTQVVDNAPDEITVTCSESLEAIINKTKSIRSVEYESAVSETAKLLDAPTSQQQRGSSYLIVDEPKNFTDADLFVNEILPDKLAMLAHEAGYSDYKLYVIFKQIDFAMPSPDWKTFAGDVGKKSSLAKGNNVLVMVVPYFATTCTSSNWFGLPISVGTGITMPGVYSSNATFVSEMNTALSAPGNSWKFNFNQALKHIPKQHIVYAYSYLWNGDFIQHEPHIDKEKKPGYENVVDIVLHDDGRYEALSSARFAAYMLPVTPSLLESEDIGVSNYAMDALSVYFTEVENAMRQENLLKVKIVSDIRQSFINEERANQYAHWFWREKTHRSAPDNLPFEAITPDDEWFYGGINKVEAENFIAVLDVASMASSFVGLDVVFDTWQAYYAYDKGFYADAAIAVSAIALEGITALEMKTVMKGLRKGELTLVKLLFNKKLLISSIERNRLYASFIPVLFKAQVQEILSTGVVSALHSRETFLTAVSYARKSDYKSSVALFEKAVAANESSFIDVIHQRPEVIDIFFRYTRQYPSAQVKEILEIAELTKGLDKLKLRTFLDDLADASFAGAVKGKPDLVDSWKVVSKHADLRTNTKFLENISGYSDDLLKQLDEDLLNPKWADELKTLFKESPDDVTNVWKKLKQDPAEAWEISKADPAWEKWSQREFFKDVTVKGKGFERDVCLTAFKNRSSVKYIELKSKVSADLGKNLDDYDMYSQVQLKYDGDNYFVADQLFVKRDALGDIEDIIVIENKLSSTTPLTTPQTNAFQRTSFTVRSQSVPSEFGSGVNLTSGKPITFSDSKQWYKVHDEANGDVISGIQQMQ
jgi:hypothetical protein